MKRILLVFSIFSASVLSAFSQPKITFDKKTQDLGRVLWRNPLPITYEFTNTGDQPLVLSKVYSSCGCTKVDWTKTSIPAGGKGKITATFDAETIGHFYKEIGVYCNASDTPIYVEFNGEVSADAADYTFTHPIAFGPIRVDKDELDFENVNKGDKPQITIQVGNASGKAYQPTLMHLPPYLSATAEPEVLGRGKNGVIKVTLDTEKVPKLGITRASVYLARFSGDKVGSDNEIPVSIILLPDFSNQTEAEKNNPPQISLSGTTLDFGQLNSHQKKSQTVLITNTGKSDLEIQDMQVFNIALAVELKKSVLKPGESTKMKITVLTENLPRVKGMPRVLMITNDPKQPSVVIRVKASVKE